MCVSKSVFLRFGAASPECIYPSFIGLPVAVFPSGTHAKYCFFGSQSSPILMTCPYHLILLRSVSSKIEPKPISSLISVFLYLSLPVTPFINLKTLILSCLQFKLCPRGKRPSFGTVEYWFQYFVIYYDLALPWCMSIFQYIGPTVVLYFDVLSLVGASPVGLIYLINRQ